MGKNAIEPRAVAQGEGQSSDGAVAPAHDGDFGDREVIEHGDGVARNVVVVEGCEVGIGGAALAACAGEGRYV